MAEKQKPKFDESRNVMYRRYYPHHYAFVKGNIMVGRTWGGEGIRKRVRALARKETRLQVRQLRGAQNIELDKAAQSA